MCISNEKLKASGKGLQKNPSEPISQPQLQMEVDTDQRLGLRGELGDMPRVQLTPAAHETFLQPFKRPPGVHLPQKGIHFIVGGDWKRSASCFECLGAEELFHFMLGVVTSE